MTTDHMATSQVQPSWRLPRPLLILALALANVLCGVYIKESWNTQWRALTELQRQTILEDFEKNGAFTVISSLPGEIFQMGVRRMRG